MDLTEAVDLFFQKRERELSSLFENVESCCRVCGLSATQHIIHQTIGFRGPDFLKTTDGSICMILTPFLREGY